MFVLLVKVKVKPEKRQQFLEVIEDDAICSVRDEPGCVRFDVLQDNADPDTYYFHEVYKDEAALQAHTQTPHLARWRKAAEEVLAEPSQVTRTTSVFPRNYT
jgi:(4S)-4-hydroxy-5-phosphonooxypentane-2,3-dione isomerase